MRKTKRVSCCIWFIDPLRHEYDEDDVCIFALNLLQAEVRSIIAKSIIGYLYNYIKSCQSCEGARGGSSETREPESAVSRSDTSREVGGKLREDWALGVEAPLRDARELAADDDGPL